MCFWPATSRIKRRLDFHKTCECLLGWLCQRGSLKSGQTIGPQITPEASNNSLSHTLGSMVGLVTKSWFSSRSKTTVPFFLGGECS